MVNAERGEVRDENVAVYYAIVTKKSFLVLRDDDQCLVVAMHKAGTDRRAKLVQ
jgi:hypothetical protein